MEFFDYERISPGIVRIRDLTHTAAYLVEGNEQACLIDVGTGIGSLREVVEKLTSKPYFVILTHGHVDHAGGSAEFSDKQVYLHCLDRKLMEAHCTEENQLDYLMHTNPGAIVGKEQLIKSLNPEKTLSLENEQRFSLGDVTLEIIHTPGHTQGMCMVLIVEERTILFGDGCGISVMLLDEYASTVKEYLTTLEKLKKHESRYDKIIRNHGTCESPKHLLDGVIDCCHCILDGTDDRVPAQHLPIQMDEAYFAKATIGNPPKRIDGGEGNIAYTPSKIR